MRWLQNISFSSNNNSSNNNNNNNQNSSSSSSPSSPKHALSSSVDSNFSSSKGHHHQQHRSYLRRGALAFRFGNAATRHTRQKNIRYLTENDVSATEKQQQKQNQQQQQQQQSSSVSTAVKSSSSAVTSADQVIQLSRSPSCSSSVVPPRLSCSVPVPLPLPLPMHSALNGDGDMRFPSPKEKDKDKDKEKDKEKDRDGVSLRDRNKEKNNDVVNGDGVPSTISPIDSLFAGRERRKMVDPLDIRSPRKVHPDFCGDNYYGDNFKMNAPTRSAPTSPFSSPIVSPQRLATAADLLPYYQMMAKNQVWSAPEMAMLDIPGLPPPAFFDYTAFSTDTSPLHSPPSISPRRNNPKSPTAASPLNAKLSIDTTSTAGRESNANLEVHPLPLPPGASRSSVSSSVPQIIPKAESFPMKSQWQKGKLIGRGTFGSVYVASNRETGALCAMKEVNIFPEDPKSAESIKQLEQEIKVLSQLKHPNIVQYYGSEIVEDHFYIYLEYVHPGSINKYAREHCGAITENVVRSFTRHILSGLAYLHSMKTIHRDIKGANLLVDASGVVKLADFGMSKHLTGQAAELSLKGSPYWMAPELMQAVMQKDTSSDLALAVDIWSLGCTIIEMFTGKPPWSDYEGAAAMFKVLKDIPPIPETLSSDGKDFLRCCFRRNPADRPSASMLLEHRWLRNLQQLDFPSSTLSNNGIKFVDLSHSPHPSEIKFDQMSILPSSQNAKGKVTSDSFMHYSFSSARMPNDVITKLPT
ncbi:mitogen-activated protein kinase kinase kinase 5 isoform X2 [Mercurialis annua]|uniref:mitogen-activated protein kinase kinase kinase 5 isoform X2 n=1 Tax=Mercurialis annua TaxID=3986 RepID=UPI00215EAA88|nr:mitogen-activated protein kinase kinase kinase 5 isoform X2 [Mercurialis annua]